MAFHSANLDKNKAYNLLFLPFYAVRLPCVFKVKQISITGTC